jgi:peptidoglycan/LPS O-acetylase OafA/YrhL
MISNSKTFFEVYDRNNNAFDMTRLILAWLVLYSHSYPLFYGPERLGDVLARLTGNQIDFGSLAVICFFVISGFLVTQSILNSKGYIDYFFKRSLRIFPALIAAAVIFSVAVGPFLSDLKLKEYFNSTVGKYIIDTITLNITGFQSTINDVFSINPYPSAINGSAWSLKHEFACYIILALLYFFFIIKHKLLLLCTTATVFILVILNISNGFYLHQSDFWIFIEPAQFTKLLFYFFAGSLFYVFREKIYYNNRFVLLTTILIILSIKTNTLQYAMLICLPYLLLSICIRIKFSSFSKYGDFSYGMYIYAFPTQQSVLYVFSDKINFIGFVSVSTLVTLILAILSWKFIEEPALRLKKLTSRMKFSSQQFAVEKSMR